MIDVLALVYIMIFIPFLCAVTLTMLKLTHFKIPHYGNFTLSLISSIFTFIISILLLDYTIAYQGYTLENNYPICIIQNIPLYFGIYADNLSSIFILLLTFMFLITNIFSYRYLLQNRQGFERFYIYINFMQFFLLCFFISSNLTQSIVFLMGISLIEYLFANFYFQKPQSQINSKKVFEINIFSDFILLVATIAFLYFSTLAPDTINIPTLGYNNINSLGLYSFASLNPVIFAIICILFIVGAIIKSSQFPFSPKTYLTSLAPNPAFSFIISPCVLSMGIFLLLRLYPILNLTPAVFEILKISGILTAIIAAIIALKENNMKNICSWAAVSQTGIAICALGFKMYGASIFYTLCAGFGIALVSYTLDTISYSTGSQENIKFLGGLREKLPLAATAFLIGSVSLAGFIFSGFYSRALILGNLFNAGNFIYIILLLFCSFLTAFYLFRTYFRIFEGDYRGTIEPKRVSRAMNFGIIILLILCIFFGFFFNNFAGSIFTLLGYNKFCASNPFVNIFAFLVSAAGYYLAYNIYFAKRLHSLRIKFLRKLASKHFYMDAFINILFNDGIIFISKILAFFEKYILGFIYSIPNLITRIISYLTVKFEPKSIKTQFFAIILWLVLILLLTSLLYFKTGVIR